jgi:hypothetical protein
VYHHPSSLNASKEHPAMAIYHYLIPRGYYVYYYLRSKDSIQSHGAKKGSPYYVGRGTRARAWNKKHTVKLPTNSNDIIIIADGLTREQADQIEILHIAIHGRLDNGTGILRNRTDGGGGAKGFKHSLEECLRIGERSKNRKASEETRARIGRANTNRVVSDETREKHRIASTGRKHSEEAINKMKEKRKLQTVSDETRQKMRESAKKRPKRVVSEETCKKLKQRALERKISRLTAQAVKEIPNATQKQIDEFVAKGLEPKVKVKGPRKKRGPRSEITKQRIGAKNKGKLGPNKGVPRSEITKSRISQSTKGKPKPPRSRESIEKGIATKRERYGKGG